MTSLVQEAGKVAPLTQRRLEILDRVARDDAGFGRSEAKTFAVWALNTIRKNGIAAWARKIGIDDAPSFRTSEIGKFILRNNKAKSWENYDYTVEFDRLMEGYTGNW